MIKSGKIILILMILSLFVSAQTLPYSSSENIKIKSENLDKKETDSSDNLQKRIRPTRQLTFLKQKQSKEQKKQLLPKTEDLNRFAAFLQQPKTGIIRLTEDIGCEPSRYVIRADEDCLKTIPGGSFYSFREREYSSSALADIRLKDGLLISDGYFSQNMLVKLGDVPLESVSLTSSGMDFLTDFVPETNTKDATRQYIKLVRGIKVGKYEYIKAFPAAENRTYAMRLIAYKANVESVYRGYIYNPLSGDERSDMIIAFRIIRKDKEGISLIWKELQRGKAPKLKLSR